MFQPYSQDPDRIQETLQAALSGRYFANLLLGHLKLVIWALQKALCVTQGCDVALDQTREQLHHIGEQMERIRGRLETQVEMRAEAAAFYERANDRVVDANLIDGRDAA